MQRFILLLTICTLRAAPPLLKQTFEDGVSGWVAFGNHGSVHGAGNLAFDYTVGEGLTAAALPLKGIDMARMQSVRFQIKTDAPTGVAMVINEKNPGGRYTAICWSSGNTWQKVEFTPADFHLSEGPNDPKDSDGKLDLDQAESIALVDLSVVLGAKVNPDSPLAIDSHAGKHTLFIADFELLSESQRASAGPAVIDDFATPQLQWITLGGAELKPEAQGMRASYEQMDERYVVLARQLGKVDLRDKSRLAFDIASDRPAQLMLSFEEHAPGMDQGPRYNATVDVAGGGKVQHREVALSAFEQAPDSPADPDGKLDLDRLKSFSVLDVTGAATHETAKNSLWIGNLRGTGN